jgi:hypothetical protein
MQNIATVRERKREMEEIERVEQLSVSFQNELYICRKKSEAALRRQ